MIDTVRMRNFKCFEDQSIQLAGLNVLAGLNGTPAISENGRLDFWPDGFFDQHEKNLAALVAPR